MTRPSVWIAGLWCALWAVAALAQSDAASAPAANEPSVAERTIFADHHLRNVKAPAQLRYSFVHTESGGADANFKDDVTILLRPGADGQCCAAEGKFLSGARALPLPDIDDARANPVTLYFLEREVRVLQRETKGQAAHFRRRIRLALADEAQISRGSAQFGGRTVATTEIAIAPFVNDPQRARFERFATKRYRFVFSNDVPGAVLRIESELPGTMSDTLTLLPS